MQDPQIFRGRVQSLLLALAIVQPLPAQQSARPDPPAPSLVIIVSGWPDYHYAGCRRLEGLTENLLAVSVGQAVARGLKPHDECDPSRRPQTEAPATPAKDARFAAKTPARRGPAHVFVVRGDRRYHTANCPKMGIGARPIRLDLLAPRFVPCPVCKPPARPRRSPAP